MARPLPNLTLAPITIWQARWKAAVLLAGCLTFVAGGAWMTTDPEASGRGAAVIAVFGVGVVIAAIVLARPASLVISSNGLTERGQWSTRRWDWRDVSDFRVWAYRRTQLVTFENAKRKRDIIRSFGLALGAGSDNLSGQWMLKPQDLADLLNEAKARWG